MKSELRVHGVSGTQPRDMLYTDPVLRDTASPDQPRSYTEVLEIAPAEEEFATQAFHWGGLTAGSRLTAFWILLAPFAFANVAGWMSKDRTNRFGHAMIRLAGLGLTALFITQVFTATVLLPYLWLLGRSEFEILGRTFEVGDGLLRWAFLLLVVVLTGAFLVLLLKASTQSHFEPRNTVEQSLVLAWPTVDSMDPTTTDAGSHPARLSTRRVGGSGRSPHHRSEDVEAEHDPASAAPPPSCGWLRNHRPRGRHLDANRLGRDHCWCPSCRGRVGGPAHHLHPHEHGGAESNRHPPPDRCSRLVRRIGDDLHRERGRPGHHHAAHHHLHHGPRHGWFRRLVALRWVDLRWRLRPRDLLWRRVGTRCRDRDRIHSRAQSP